MNKKIIIEVIVTTAAFVGSGVVLYKGLHSAPLPISSVPASAIAVGNVLPYGDNFDFSILTKQKLEFGKVIYKVLDPQSEVGVETKNLIRPQVK